MAKKPKAGADTEITPDEVVHEAEAQGLVSHDEAEEILEAGDESDVKRPELTGTNKLPKTDFEQPGSDNQKRTVIEE